MIYLASRSPRRQDLLKSAGIAYRMVKTHFRERIEPRKSPQENAVLNAARKSLHAYPVKSGIVLGADTLIDFKGKIIGKPKNYKEAKRFLTQFSGKTHLVITGVGLSDGRTKRLKTFYVTSRVTFKKLTSKKIEAYLKTGEYRDKAGAYGYQEKGRALYPMGMRRMLIFKAR